MSDPVDALVLDLLEWIGSGPRPYPEVMEAWRTSCPRLPVWEEANARGLLSHQHRPGVGAFVSVSVEGRAYLDARRRAPLTVAEDETGDAGVAFPDTGERKRARA